MIAAHRLALVALLGAPGMAHAQDGSPWGQSEETTKTAPREAAEDEADAEEAEDEGEEAEEGADEDTVTAPRGEAAEPEGPELAEVGAEIDRIELVVEPETVAPGAEVSVTVTFWTADDKAVPEVAFDLLGKGGEVGDLTEENGVHTGGFTVSRYAEDEAKLSVVTESGMMQMQALTIDEDAADTVTVAKGEEPREKPVEEKPPKEPKEKKESVARDPLWLHLRAQGAGATYRYAQTPDADDSGPLIEDELAFGGEAGGPASAMGFDLSGTVWVPDLPWLGAQANVRMLGYAVTSGAFNGEARDYLVDIGVFGAARIPVEVGDGQLWGGGRLGFHYGDFLLFEGCLDPGCGVEFGTVATPGVGVGPRGGIEYGIFVGELGYTAYLARATQPYANGLDLNAGVIVFEPVTVELGVDYIARTIALSGKDSGEVRGTIRDGQTVISLGVGTVF